MGSSNAIVAVSPDGLRVRALYLLERQADGSWRTSGCLLFEPDEAPISA